MLATRLMGATSQTPPTLQFGEGRTSTTDASTTTFSGMSIGTANAGRYVVVGVAYRYDSTTNPTIPVVTVGGQATTAIISTMNDSGASSINRTGVVLYITNSPVTTGATANVVITATGRTMSRSFASTYALTKSGAPSVASSQASAVGSSTNPLNFSVTKTASQVGVVVCHAVTFSGLTNVEVSGSATQNYNSGVVELGAYLSATVTGTGTITLTTTGASSLPRAVVVTWS